MDQHRRSRRLFLNDLGKGGLAVAIMGFGVAACSTDGTVSVTRTSTTGSILTSTVPPSSPTSAAETATGSIDAELRWERVNFNFVSAYLLARGNRVAIVDTGTAGGADRFDDAFRAVGLGWSDVDDVIITHLHADHVGGLGEVLTAAAGATAWAGDADIAGISSPRSIRPLFDGDEVFGLSIIGTPGHTEGHVSVVDQQAGLLIAGDALNEEAGRIVGPNPDFTPDMDRANQSVKLIAQWEFGTAVFGHGEPVLTGAAEQVAALAATL